MTEPQFSYNWSYACDTQSQCAIKWDFGVDTYVRSIQPISQILACPGQPYEAVLEIWKAKIFNDITTMTYLGGWVVTTDGVDNVIDTIDISDTIRFLVFNLVPKDGVKDYIPKSHYLRVYSLPLCYCDAWRTYECVGENLRKQTRLCYPSGCDVEGQTISDTTCAGTSPICSSIRPDLCKTQTDCVNAGLYWYNNKCNIKPYTKPVEKHWLTQQTIITGVPNWAIITTGIAVPATVIVISYLVLRKPSKKRGKK